MKTYIHCLITFLIAGFSSYSNNRVQAQCPTSPASQTVTCGSNVVAYADTVFTRYALTRISCSPYTITGTNAFPTACDDCITGQINIGFPFNFYGNTYTTAIIQSNGIVGFGPFSYTGYMPYSIPANGDPDNYIAGFYADIDIRNGGSITYQTIGTAPNRKFVVSYNNVAPFGTGGTGTATFQIVLNEDNSFHVIISSISSNWYATTSGNFGTSGAENSNGGVAFVVEDRNYSTTMLGITSGNRDCTHFNPQPCAFLGWYQGSTRVQTTGKLTATINNNQSFTPRWRCGTDTCIGNPVNFTVNTSNMQPISICQYDAAQSLTYTGSCSPSGVGVVAQNTTFNTGALTTTDPQYGRVGSGTSCSPSSSTNYYYDVFSFIPSVTGSYTFNMCHVGSTFDGHAALFVDNFNPSSPCSPNNLVMADDDSNGSNCSQQPRITATLTAGRTYYLVSSTFSSNVTGNYQWTFTGPSGATLSANGVNPTPINWYTSATSTTPIATGSTFNPIGVAGSGITNTNTPGTWTYYVACGSSTNCRQAVTYTITAAPQSDITVNICTNTTAQAITPSLSCNSTPAIIQPGSIFNAGTLSTTDATITRVASTTSCLLTAGTSHYVDVFRFQVTQAGSYTFNNCATSMDAYAVLFSGGFNPAAPCASTFIVGNDDASNRGCTSDPQITATLSPGIDYYLITTSYSASITGSYDWTYTTTSTGRVEYYTTLTQIEWFTSPSATTPIHTGTSFNPVGISGSGLTNTATVGTNYYYYKCMPSTGCINRAVYNITQAPTAFTTITAPTGAQCPNTPITLSASGGVTPAGATVRWYTGTNGTGTLVGTGNSITVTPNTSTTYYVRKESACGVTPELNRQITLKQFVYAPNGTVATDYCTDADQWHHFYTGDDIILSLKGDIASMNNISANIGVNSTYYQNTTTITLPSCEPRPNEKKFEMRRNWNINYSGAIAPPYQVRFYHQPSEKAEIISAANTWMSTYSPCGYTYKHPYPNGFYWFKNDIGAYAAPQYDGIHLAGSNPATTANGINYETLSNITSFSGGSGGIILVPNPLLDNSILNFTGVYQAALKANMLKWNLDTQREVAYFELYHSKDGANNWTYLATIEKQEDLEYVYGHENPSTEMNYYQLKVYLQDASHYTSQIIAIANPKGNTSFVVYPNPTQNTVYYEVSLEQAEQLQVELLNVLGQTIQSSVYDFEAGVQRITIAMNTLPSGTYLLRVMHNQSQLIHTVPVVKAD